MLQIAFETQGGPWRLTEEEAEAQREEYGVGRPNWWPIYIPSAHPQGHLRTASYPAMASHMSLPERGLWPQKRAQPAGRTGHMCQEVNTVNT